MDGAANMSGQKSGLCTLIKANLSQKSVYVHCYAHKLNLAVEAACLKVPAVCEVLEIAKTLYAYVEGSTKRHHLFQHLQDNNIRITLKKLCETRWHHRVASFTAIKKCYTALLTFLEIQDDDLITKCGATASGLLKKIKTFNFVFYSELLLKCFKIINILNESLQKEDLDIVKAQDLYKIAHSELVDLKFDEQFEQFYGDVAHIAHTNDIDVPTASSTQSKKRRNSASSSEQTTDNSKQRLKDLFCKTVDTLINEIDIRFKEENIEQLVAIHKIITSDQLDRIEIEKQLAIYKCDIDFDRLEIELPVWYAYKKINTQLQGNRLSEIRKYFVSLNLKDQFGEIFKLFKIYLSIPVSSVSAERSFSCMKRIKTYIRNKMNEERLSDLAVLNIESEQLQKIATDCIIDLFAESNCRRVDFFKLFL